MLNVNQWRLGFTLDPRCIACKNIRKAIKDVHEKMEQEGVNVETLLNKDCVYDCEEVQHYTNVKDAHPERSMKKCTNCGDTGHTQHGYKRWKGQQFQIVGGCHLEIRDFNAPQLNTDWMNCRAGLKD